MIYVTYSDYNLFLATVIKFLSNTLNVAFALIHRGFLILQLKLFFLDFILKMCIFHFSLFKK